MQFNIMPRTGGLVIIRKKEGYEGIILTYICHYLKGISKYCLTYDSTSGQGLIACTDSDWASDSNNKWSQTGYFLKLAGGAISWTSR